MNKHVRRDVTSTQQSKHNIPDLDIICKADMDQVNVNSQGQKKEETFELTVLQAEKEYIIIGEDIKPAYRRHA